MAAVVVGLERRTHDSLLRVMVAGSERRDVAQHDDDAGRDGHALRLFFYSGRVVEGVETMAA